MYTKFIVVTDDDVDIRDWKEVIWAITTRMDPVRDTTWLKHAHRLSGLRFAGQRAGGQDGAGCHQQVARRESSREWGR
jgi:4-hydroxy-3-polyprenylbenzoate decarboxylase